jgi:hypothetical protein
MAASPGVSRELLWQIRGDSWGTQCRRRPAVGNCCQKIGETVTEDASVCVTVIRTRYSRVVC